MLCENKDLEQNDFSSAFRLDLLMSVEFVDVYINFLTSSKFVAFYRLAPLVISQEQISFNLKFQWFLELEHRTGW